MPRAVGAATAPVGIGAGAVAPPQEMADTGRAMVDLVLTGGIEVDIPPTTTAMACMDMAARRYIIYDKGIGELFERQTFR